MTPLCQPKLLFMVLVNGKKNLNRGTWDRVAGCGDDGAEMVFVVLVKVLLVVIMVKQCI